MNILSHGLLWSVVFLGARNMNAEIVRVHDRPAMVEAFQKAQPGTTILLKTGNYGGGLSFSGVTGEQGNPIVLASEDPKRPAVFEGGNTSLHLSRASHVELRDLVFQGARANGLNIDDAGDRDASAHHITLRGLVVRDIGPKGNRDGIKLSGLTDFLVQDCTVERWGDGGSAIDMVGCHQGRIVDCRFQQARGEAANGIQAKGGSRGITIERCHFRQAGGRGVNAGGSTGLDYFRPPQAAYEAKDITVQDCFFTSGSAPVAFVGVENALFQYNTIYRPKRWVLRILQENQNPRFVKCRDGRFLNNIIVFDSRELRSAVNIGPMTLPETFKFEGNVWHCLDRPRATQRLVQLPVQEVEGFYGVNPKFQDAEKGDLTLRTESSLKGKGVR